MGIRDSGLMVEDLMGVALGQGLVDAAGHEDQRHAILLRVGDDIDGIGDAGTERRDQHGQCTGRVPEPFRHEARGVLVPREFETDAGPFERIDQRQHLAAGNAEGMGRARRHQALGDDVRAGETLRWRRVQGNGIGYRLVAHQISPANRAGGFAGEIAAEMPSVTGCLLYTSRCV